MGADPQAILFYGIAYDQGELPEDHYDLDMADKDRRQNEAVPKPPVPGPHGPEWDAWRKRRKVWESAHDPVSLSYRGYDGNMLPHLYIRPSRISVEWADVEDVASLDVGPTWDDDLRTYCERLRFPFKPPGWKLVSWYF